MRLATISLNIFNQDIDANLKKAKNFIAKAKQDNCDVIVFPEIFDIGFSIYVDKYLQDSYEKTYKSLKSLAAKHAINIIAGFGGADYVFTHGEAFVVWILMAILVNNCLKK